MSDNIPFEIQMEIMKWIPVKPLLQFRSVSKGWKSFIDSSDFIKAYGARHTHPHSHILSYCRSEDLRYNICLVKEDDDDIKVQQLQEFIMSPLLKQYGTVSYVVGESHGLLCLCCSNDNKEEMLVIWNPSIRKSFGVAVPTFDRNTYYGHYFSFGVCPIASDPTVVMTLWPHKNMPCRVEVFTLSSGVWNSIPTGNLPRQSVKFKQSEHVVIDRFIYWGAQERISHAHLNNLVVSFDMITTEFKVLDLPDSLTNESLLYLPLSKLRDSLVVSGAKGPPCCGVWVMEHDSFFRKLFNINIGALFYKVLGFWKNGEPICEIGKIFYRGSSPFYPEICEIGKIDGGCVATLSVYDPYSQQIKSLGISGVATSLFMGSYKESLLLLDHSDLHIYSDDS